MYLTSDQAIWAGRQKPKPKKTDSRVTGCLFSEGALDQKPTLARK